MLCSNYEKLTSEFGLILNGSDIKSLNQKNASNILNLLYQHKLLLFKNVQLNPINELIMWDNRSLIHRAFPSLHGGNRLMFRIGIQDIAFFGI